MILGFGNEMYMSVSISLRKKKNYLQRQKIVTLKMTAKSPFLPEFLEWKMVLTIIDMNSRDKLNEEKE